METRTEQMAGTGMDPTSGVLARLQHHRAEREGVVSFQLPETGVTVTFPKFKPYDLWQRAQRLGDGKTGQFQLYYIVALCQFDGERLTKNDYAELIPADDHVAILNHIYANEGDEENTAEAEGRRGNGS